jgi:hypothetical protein
MTLSIKLEDNALTQLDERMVRVIIPALGATRMPSASIALRTVAAVNWTGTVKRLADEALKNIPSSGEN